MAFSRLYRRDSVGGYDEERFENEVDSKLLCPICLKVFNDPVQCPNEHYFCRLCIKKHLHENSETCPMCQHHLTETTLTKAPRFLMETLLDLKIRCNYADRGCQELIKLEFLDRHVENCGYSPTPCTNPGCSQEINQRDKEQHESELCHFRMVACDDCGQEVLRKSNHVHACFMRKDMDDIVARLNVFNKDMSEVKDDVKQLKLTQEEFIKKVRDMMIRQAASQDEMRAEIACVTKEATERSDLFTGRLKIFVFGGDDGKTVLNTVESYSWPENVWKLEPMKEKRSAASAFVHKQQIFVAGGWTGTKDSDSIESLDVDKEPIEWIELPVKVPFKCLGHKTICHENTAILTGGRDGDHVSDKIYEIQRNPPYATKLLTEIPGPRFSHGCEIIDNQIVIVGGRTSEYANDATKTVYVYDITSNECKPIAPLPFAISDMATVSYKDNLILIGGVSEEGQTLNTVIMYNVKTGKIKMLPCPSHKRANSAAVIIGNVILVMGGYVYETKTRLDSVECFDLSTNRWRELSSMTTKRGGLTAVVKPIS